VSFFANVLRKRVEADAKRYERETLAAKEAAGGKNTPRKVHPPLKIRRSKGGFARKLIER
jgi:hypothetical protein